MEGGFAENGRNRGLQVVYAGPVCKKSEEEKDERELQRNNERTGNI